MRWERLACWEGTLCGLVSWRCGDSGRLGVGRRLTMGSLRWLKQISGLKKGRRSIGTASHNNCAAQGMPCYI
jgi:hypothetical protein